MNVAHFLVALRQESDSRAYIRRLEIRPRHPAGTPHTHDTSAEGRRSVTLAEFLNEVEVIMADKNLP